MSVLPLPSPPRLPDEYILEAGYYPDDFVTAGLVPDVFFIHCSLDVEAERLGKFWEPLYVLLPEGREFYWGVLADAVSAVGAAVSGKYHLDEVPWQDLFWSVRARPA